MAADPLALALLKRARKILSYTDFPDQRTGMKETRNGAGWVVHCGLGKYEPAKKNGAAAK